jgi:UDP-glucose 4-epimerase
LVTGGAGFIGSHLVDLLVRDGFPTTVLDDLSAGSASNVPEAASLVEGDVRDVGLVDDLVKDADYVFHLAAYTSSPGSLDEPQVCFEINTLGTLNVLQSARRHKIQKIIFPSSSAVYGGDSQDPCKEEDSLEPMCPYAVTKLAGEHLLEVYRATYGLPYVAFRFFNVYGPRQNPEGGYAAVVPAFIQAALRGEDMVGRSCPFVVLHHPQARLMGCGLSRWELQHPYRHHRGVAIPRLLGG